MSEPQDKIAAEAAIAAQLETESAENAGVVEMPSNLSASIEKTANTVDANAQPRNDQNLLLEDQNDA